MNTLVRRLLSGASLATLQLCAVTAARASAINITAAQTTGPITVAAGQNPDLIAISGTVTGDVTNDGTVSMPGSSNIGVIITGSIEGALKNAKSGIIYATASGIDVGGMANIAGGIDNEGKILVARTSDLSAPMNGINDSSADNITNNGTISVTASADDLHNLTLSGIVKNVAGGANPVAVSIINAGHVSVSAQETARPSSTHAAGGGLFVHGIGLKGDSSSTVALALTNSGLLSLNAAMQATNTGATLFFVEAIGNGLSEAARGITSGSAALAANLTLDNSGSLFISAKAVADGDGDGGQMSGSASIEGISQEADARNKAVVAADNAGKISLSATALAFDAHSATADADVVAVYQDVFAENSAAGTFDNSGDVALHVVAKATGSVAFAYAVGEGVFQQGQAANLELAITNSGSIALALTDQAQGIGRASAQAFASRILDQNVFVTTPAASIVQTISNSGTIALRADITANAAQSANATARLTIAVQHVGPLSSLPTAPTAPVDAVSAAISNSGTITVQADVGASGGTAGRASNNLTVFNQSMDLENIASGVAMLSESNSRTIAATLVAIGATDANAGALAFNQTAKDAKSITETVDNTGSLTVNAKSGAKNDASGLIFGTFSEASAFLTRQTVKAVDNAALAVNNAGSMVAHATAAVTALSDIDSFARVTGIRQSAPFAFSSPGPFSASMRVNNSGTIALSANVTADVTGTATDAFLEAEVLAVNQSASSGTTLTESFSNSGRIDAIATASQNLKVPPADAKEVDVAAVATGLLVSGGGSSGVFHFVSGTSVVSRPSPLSATVSNGGTIDISAVASGLSANATANGIIVARASVTAVTNVRVTASSVTTEDNIRRNHSEPLSGFIDNSGDLIVSATAIGGKANAEAILVRSSDPDMPVTNSGLIAASADGATATANGLKLASHSNLQRVKSRRGSGTLSTANQIYTNVFVPADMIARTVSNSGALVVNAIGTVNANAEGISLNTLDMAAQVVNSGAISVAAAGPVASAVGLKVHAMRSGTSRSFPDHRTTGGGFTSTPHHAVLSTAIAGSKFTGTVDNSGTIAVSATGSGASKATAIEVDVDSDTGKILNEDKIVASASGTGAIATGIAVNAASFNGSLVNKGTISASASGSGASAKGVAFATTSTGGAAVFENDGGTISAFANGVWGTAIDASAAADTLVLTLNGGSIVGNIVENASGNAIAINSGNLLFDGIINPSKAKLGSLTVGANGALTLANDIQGDATAYVANYVQSGKLIIPGTLDGSSGAIHAGAATLSGQAVVDLQLGGAPYALSTTYKVVFSDIALSGTWSSVVPDAATTFFSASGVYSANEADITLTRATFDGVKGLTANEQAVGHVIETVYDGGSSGVMSKLIGALFDLTPAQYADALEALSGVPAGEMSAVNQSSAQSFLDLINNHLGDPSTGENTMASLLSGDDALAAAPADVSPAQASDLSGTTVWGGGFQSGNSVNATTSGPGYSSHQSGLLAGIDVAPTRNILFGIAASYGTGDIKTDKLLGFGTLSAAQVAGYGRFTADDGLYALADASYGNFTNKLNRYVSIPGFGAGNLHGAFDSTSWGLYGEAGWHFAPDGWAVTPYAAISYLDADSDGYKETGVFPLPLTVAGSSSKATSSYLGLKLATDWQIGSATVTPRITAAWQHDYTKNAWEMGAAFTAVPTAGFGLTGSDQARDSAYVDGGLTLHIADQVDVLLDYQGRFNADRTDNAFLARANVRF